MLLKEKVRMSMTFAWLASGYTVDKFGLEYMTDRGNR